MALRALVLALAIRALVLLMLIRFVLPIAPLTARVMVVIGLLTGSLAPPNHMTGAVTATA
jgi:hypothetical protein